MSRLFVRYSYLYLPVKSSRSSQGGVEGFRSVCRAYDYEVSSSCKSVHQSEELGNNSPLNLTCHFFSFRRDGVKLVDENNAGRIFLSFLKHLTESSL